MKVRELINQLRRMDPDATAYLEADDSGKRVSGPLVLINIEVVEGQLGSGDNMDVVLVPEIPVRAAQPVHVPR